MPSLKNIQSQYAFAIQLQSLVRTSQEISVMRIQQIRRSAEGTRSYMEGLHEVFFDVRSSHERQIQTLLEKHTINSGKNVNPKKEAVLVFISTHERFAGNIIPSVFKQFAEDVKKTNADVVVIGSVGRDLFSHEFGSSRPFTYSDMSITHPQTELLKQLLGLLLQYKRIDVYKGRYQSLVTQLPDVINISGNERLKTEKLETTENVHNFLFEPTLEQLVSFFETQITASLFRLNLDESRLANLGSRITALESSLNNLQREITVLERREHMEKRAKQNRKQLQRISGMALW